MRRALALLAMFASACTGHGPRQVGSQPSWRTGGGAAAEAPTTKVVGPVTFAPSGTAATRYNEPVQAPPHSPLGDATIARLVEVTLA